MEVDLVAKLREYAIEPGRYWLDNYGLQAADELERIQIVIKHLEKKLIHLESEIARLERMSNG
jgi:uncharacterized protein YcfL